MADLNDKRLTSVFDGQDEELAEDAAMYDGMIAENDSVIQQGIENSEKAKEEQIKLQNEKTDFQIQGIEQQKEQANKDYIKEQSGAYVDWQKESSKYGANAERMAESGLIGSGFHESSQVSMYNAYQNRVAVARESFERTKLNYDNAIQEAKLQNSSILAEIALNASKEQLTLTLEGLQYKNTLLLEKAKSSQQIKDRYYSKWKDMLDQINTEAALAEQQRQFNASLAEEQRQFDILHGGTDLTENDVLSDGQDARNFKTEYFEGSIPSTTLLSSQAFGTFSNGYQPKGILSHGALKKTGNTIDVYATTLSGEKKTVVQNIWQAEDKTLWIWDGSTMQYKKFGTGITNSEKKTISSTTTSSTYLPSTEPDWNKYNT